MWSLRACIEARWLDACWIGHVVTHTAVMNESQTHTVELQLLQCWNNFTQGYMAACLCGSDAVTARLLHFFNSQSGFKVRQQSLLLLPSHTPLHTRHAALTIPTQTDAPHVPLQTNSHDNSLFWSGCWSAITNFNNEVSPLTDFGWCNTEQWWQWNCREELKDPSHLQSSDHCQHCCYVIFGQVNAVYVYVCM